MVNLRSTNTWLVELVINCLWVGLQPDNNIAIVIVTSNNTEAAPCGFLSLFPNWCVFIPCMISTNSLMNFEVIGLLILIPIKVTMKISIWPAIPSTFPNGMWIRNMGFGLCRQRNIRSGWCICDWNETPIRGMQVQYLVHGRSCRWELRFWFKSEVKDWIIAFKGTHEFAGSVEGQNPSRCLWMALYIYPSIRPKHINF